MPRKRQRVERHSVIQPLDSSYRLIPLTKGQNAIVDAKDFDWLSQWNWYATWSKSAKGFYAVRTMHQIGMHRVILNCEKGQQVDHINRNTLDNRRENLRKCTRAQNLWNSGKQANNTSGFKGVHAERGKWIAVICVNWKRIRLGSFVCPKEAAKAYDQAAKLYHGEFALLNFR